MAEENKRSESRNFNEEHDFMRELLAKLGFKGEKQRKVKMLLLALLIGIILMIFSSCGGLTAEQRQDNEDGGKSESVGAEDTEAQLENKLAYVLSKIKGVGEVSVSVTLVSCGKTEYAVNASTTVNTTSENSADGSSKSVTQTTDSNDIVFENNNKTPVVVRQIGAEVQGVLVVAAGGDLPDVRSKITTAVSALLDIPAHKITVYGSDLAD